ncbi:MAG: zinc ABC transporter substrate-binding protein [Spongiibacteraceae bacterium]
MNFRKLIAAWCLFLGVGSAIAAEPPLRVLTTIKPLQLIALAVTGGDPDVQVDVLLAPQSSPHDYQLKPSDREKIAVADAIFWVGPGLELFLERVLTSAGDARAVALQPDGSHHDDAHIWMEPMAAAEIADQLVAHLAQLRPQQAAVWRRNAADLRRRLTALDRELAIVLRVQSPQGYLVSHDAFARFESRYGLRHVAALSDGEERPPGPRRIAAIKAGIARGEIGCALLEPQYDRKTVRTVFGDTAVRQINVDTLAGDIAPDREGLEKFYRGLGRVFRECIEK